MMGAKRCRLSGRKIGVKISKWGKHLQYCTGHEAAGGTLILFLWLKQPPASCVRQVELSQPLIFLAWKRTFNYLFFWPGSEQDGGGGAKEPCDSVQKRVFEAMLIAMQA